MHISMIGIEVNDKKCKNRVTRVHAVSYHHVVMVVNRILLQI